MTDSNPKGTKPSQHQRFLPDNSVTINDESKTDTIPVFRRLKINRKEFFCVVP